MKLVKQLFGSRLHNLHNENSDVDYKEIFAPSLFELIRTTKHSYMFSTGGSNKNGNGDVDIERISIQKFVSNALDCKPYTTTMLYSKATTYSTPLWRSLVSKREQFLSKTSLLTQLDSVKKYTNAHHNKYERFESIKEVYRILSTLDSDKKLKDVVDELYVNRHVKLTNIVNEKTNSNEDYYDVLDRLFSFHNTVGYTLEQVDKIIKHYGKRTMSSSESKYDPKELTHLLITLFQIKHLVSGDMQIPLPENEYLRTVKEGNANPRDVLELMANEVEIVIQQVKDSSLPELPNSKFVDDFLYYEVYGLK